MKIGELARATSTAVETIRYYEREGLLPAAARTDANYRHYTEAHTRRLQFVRHCRSLDMSLQEIRTLLAFQDAPGEPCGGVNAVLDTHIDHVVRRIQELRALEKQLKALRALCEGTADAEHCRILDGLSHAAPAATGGAHVQGAHR